MFLKIQQFGAITLQKRRKEKPNKKQREANRLEKDDKVSKVRKIEAISAELLTFKTIKEGMTIMGCVKSIEPTSISVSLPGRIIGKVDVTEISQTYLQLANNFVNKRETNDNDDDASDSENDYRPLNQLFSIGQVVCVKVVKINAEKSSLIKIDLTMQPNAILSDYQHNAIETGMILSVAIAGREEHGFVIETGVNNLRGFLPDTYISAEQKSQYSVGGVYFCRVEKIKTSSAASTAIFQMVNQTKSRKVKGSDEPNVNYILPGTLATFSVTKILKDGLQGTIFNNSLIAYINEHQLGTDTSKLERFAEPKNFEIGSELTARILYVMPLTKLVYLSLNLQDKFAVNSTDDSQKILPVGTIVENATVSHIGTGGVVLRLNKDKAKGVISLRSMKVNITENFDKDEILAKYYKKSQHTVRVIHYDPIDLLHVCSVDKRIINEKYFTINDLAVGDYVDAIITRKLTDGRYEINVGSIKGFLHPLYLSPSTTAKLLVPKKKLRCRIICKSENKHEIFVTNRKEFMSEDATILSDATKIKIGALYVGVVKKSRAEGWLIEFFNYIKGMVYRNQLTASELATAERFYEGQVLKVSVKLVTKTSAGLQMTLGLGDFVVETGVVLSGKVAAIQPTGIDVAFSKKNVNGFVPIMYVSDYPSLAHAVHLSYRCNDDIVAIGVSQNCYSIRDANDSTVNLVKNWSKLNVDDVIPASVSNVADDVIDVQCFIKEYKKLTKIHLKMFLENYGKAGDVNLVPDQKIFVKVLAKNNLLRTLTCSAKLRDVWHGDLNETTKIFQNYFTDMERIRQGLANERNSITNYRIGEIVEGQIIKMEKNELENGKWASKTLLLPGNVKAVLTTANDDIKKDKKLKENEIQKSKFLIVWIDYVNQIVYGTTKSRFLERIKSEQNEDDAGKTLLTHPGLKADVLLILDDLIVLYPRKVTNRFIYVPTRFHYNDFQPVISNGIVEGSIVNVTAIDTKTDRFIGIFDHFYSLYERFHVNKTIKTDTDSNENGENVENDDSVEEEAPVAKKKKLNNNTAKALPQKKIDSPVQSKNNPKKRKAPKKSNSNGKPVRFSLRTAQLDGAVDLAIDSDDSDDEIDTKPSMPGVSNFWSTDLNVLSAANQSGDVSSSEESSSDDESGPEKKKKLTAQERFAATRIEEARIHEIEKSYADDSVQPTTVDQFDRLVMAEPNNSRAWINYMVFHVQATEIDRARSIAQKALKTIDFRETQERINIWVALLNMELRFGSKDAFDDTLKEALQVNEPFKIYSISLQILADCKRVPELCDMIMSVTKKFRNISECWLNAAQAYFEVDLPDKAKPLLSRALISLPERDRKYINYKITAILINFFF